MARPFRLCRAVLIVFRLVWGFVGGEHSRFSDFVRPSRIADHISGLLRGRSEATLGHNPLGAVSVLILLALIGVTVWTGALGGHSAKDVHELIGWTLLAVVGLHVIAVIAMSLLQRENLVRAMVTGNKWKLLHPGAADARRPSAAGLLIAVLVLVATVYAILRYDPQAFSLRSAETFEHRAGAINDYTRHTEDRDEND